MDEERIAAAIKIIMEPWYYKVCEGCDSILRQSAIICPSCKSYRFDETELSILKMASDIGLSEQKTVTEEDLF